MQWRIMKRLEEKLKPTDPALAWEKKNEWFGSKDHHNIEATRIAFATHEYLCALCYLEIDSDEYYVEINAAVNKYFPGLARL